MKGEVRASQSFLRTDGRVRTRHGWALVLSFMVASKLSHSCGSLCNQSECMHTVLSAARA